MGGKNDATGYIIPERKIKEEITPRAVERMFELDFSEKEKGLAMSKEDREFLKKVENGIVNREDSHYELPLPFQEVNVILPKDRKTSLTTLKES